ncbi:cytochrome ubiquinol oxidase subunit I [Streptomyces sp. TS71-3]|uniref:cytochrome ubiquinol oxidase subunit I n=1 Tax=Streptomyces sp. TS71-3 TaxID=2733862 RepID=UPI001B11410A|nr:cytochrome ubiquinol oxidase subunit I [Streptomyces sp. TS71-3]GHJ42377.1 cytochrome ubiquinol oxidase subunit I [Streptomyces sp. TS71-3]
MTGWTLAFSEADLAAARAQMGFSLAWHIVLACLGVGLPLLTLAVEWYGIRTGDSSLRLLARRWARGMGVLFAVGAVSGTILSFEMGLLWPGLMGRFGQVLGLPFALEGFAFFLEAIFLGLYLYAWDRLPPKQHLLMGVPIVISGTLSAFFVVCANAWMNQPSGITLHRDGTLAHVSPWAAMLNPSSPPQTVHMILAAFNVAAFLTASVYAVALLRGRNDTYHRVGFLLPFAFGSLVSVAQFFSGDWLARFLAHYQPVKLAGIEGVFHTDSHVPITILGAAPDNTRLEYGLKIPSGLSFLVGFSPDTVVQGLNEVPRDQWPVVTALHLCFDVMVGIDGLLIAMGAVLLLAWWRARRTGRVLMALRGHRLFLLVGALCGPLSVVALECGWTITELGRQPWIVYGVMRVREAVNPAPALQTGLWLVLAVYTAMTVATVYVMRRMVRTTPVPIAPQESDVERFHVT